MDLVPQVNNMARSSACFYLDISFMTEEDKDEIASEITSCDPEWIKKEWILDKDRTELSASESGMSWDAYEDMIYKYCSFIEEKYPNVTTHSFVRFDFLICEGEYQTNIDVEDGVIHIKEMNAPLNLPGWCPECDADLDDIDLSELTEDTYQDYEVTCPKCGHKINLYEEYEIDIAEYIFQGNR